MTEAPARLGRNFVYKLTRTAGRVHRPDGQRSEPPPSIPLTIHGQVTEYGLSPTPATLGGSFKQAYRTWRNGSIRVRQSAEDWAPDCLA
jgi:hypothetical protein